MAKNTKIEWCDHTVNLWWGCEEVHSGCDNCYAKTLSKRWGYDLWNNTQRKEITNAFEDLKKINKLNPAGKMEIVFMGSMMDIFEKPIPVQGKESTTDKLRSQLFENIQKGMYPNIFFLFLTKRPSNIAKYIPEEWLENPPKNIMYLCSVSDQKQANTLIPQLSKLKGYKGLSIEPQLDEIRFDIHNETGDLLNEIDWIIQGGESGHSKRPFQESWAESMQRDCWLLGVPYFFKQIDKVKEIPENLLVRQYPTFLKR